MSSMRDMMLQSGFTRQFLESRTCPRPRTRIAIPMTHPASRETIMPTAAPATPSAGSPQAPKIKA